MSKPSFFDLTTQPSLQEQPWNPWGTITPEEFDVAHTAACPLSDLLLEAIDAYAKVHGLTMLEDWLAADMTRYSLGCQIREDEADA
jgi:hypothetical protein